jgi:hypothetical protein
MGSKIQEPKNRRTKPGIASVAWFFGFLALWFFGSSVIPTASGQTPVAIHSVESSAALTDEELGTPQQQALLMALAGVPYGHRAADHARAGCAMLIRPHAIGSNTPHYGGYWVGGGKAVRGEKPFQDEGTFGWDYFGILFTKRIALSWSHGRRYQGGTGAYQTDGPKLH